MPHLFTVKWQQVCFEMCRDGPRANSNYFQKRILFPISVFAQNFAFLFISVFFSLFFSRAFLKNKKNKDQNKRKSGEMQYVCVRQSFSGHML
jgi:hypothetical protein